MLGVGAKKKAYIDDVFSTQVYTGTGSARSINNGVNLSGKGGLVWSKIRSNSYSHAFVDTERGATKVLRSEHDYQETTDTNTLTAFSTTGYSLGADTSGWVNYGTGTNTSASWTFRKAKGFFDVVTWTGDSSSNRQISHSLSSIPGLIMVKKTSEGDNWNVYHRSAHASSPEDYRLFLNTTAAASTNDSVWNETKPTSSHFTVGNNDQVNGNGKSYVAYVFAGGESTAATATSCNFLGTASDGDDNKIWVGNSSDTSSDLVYGTGDLTIEAWVKCQEADSNIYKRIIHHGHEWNQQNTHGFMWDRNNDNKFGYHSYSIDSSNPIIAGFAHPEFNNDHQWHHVALTRASGTFRLFVDGVLESTVTGITATLEGNSITSNYATIGATHNHNQNECFKGNISNVRIVKGTAVYTSSFKVPTEPLTNITNTKLLCCNGSSTTSATVTPKTLVSDATVTINTSDSPFDDPAAFKFGGNEDQGIIKTGSYVGNGNTTGPKIYLGWEPQWVMIKLTSGSNSWYIWDSMRGIVSGGNDPYLQANDSGAEADGYNPIELTSTGFKLVTSSGTWVNGSGSNYVYMAIRRPDGYVGKPADAGTDVFSMHAGSTDAPLFKSGHIVDMQMVRRVEQSASWETGARLLRTKQVYTDTDGPETEIDSTNWDYDFMDGWHSSTTGASSDTRSWMWKRHAGFDVVTYTGNGSAGLVVNHSMNKIPEMIWVKNRSTSSSNWVVYHKGLNGGTNPETHYLRLNLNGAEGDYDFFNDYAPTSTHFKVVNHPLVNDNGDDYIAMLFASIPKISAVGSYTGNGSTGQTITLGFQPRFVIIKAMNMAEHWEVLDTSRGWGSGDDEWIRLSTNEDQNEADYGAPTSTGFTLTSGNNENNSSSGTYLYYAHA